MLVYFHFFHNAIQLSDDDCGVGVGGIYLLALSLTSSSAHFVQRAQGPKLEISH